MCAERFSPHYFVQVSIKVVHVQKIHSKKKKVTYKVEMRIYIRTMNNS